MIANVADTFVVFDTSAIFTLVDDEAGAERVAKYLRQAEDGKITLMQSFVSLTEVRYIVTQERNESDADHLLSLILSWPVQWIHSETSLCLLAAHFKANHRLSFADAFVAATAHQYGATLVHKDPEFSSLSAQIKMDVLPLK